jgi:hypothetical protein
MRFVVVAAVFVIGALTTGACAAPSNPPPTPAPAATPLAASTRSPAAVPTPQTAPVLSQSPEPDDQQQQAVVDEAVRQAAAYANVSASDVKVQQAEAREWGDSSLGCPRPGQMYSQVVTPGFLIVLQAGTRVLEYHSDARGRLVLCQER